MSLLLRSSLTTCQLNSPPFTPRHSVLQHPTQFRVWNRRRRRRRRLRSPRAQSSFETLMHSLVSRLDLIAPPTLGFASGLASALFFLNPTPTPQGSKEECEDCVLFTSPTAFNRFVVLRCPSISSSFQAGGNQEELLNQEDTPHFVRIRVNTNTNNNTNNNTGSSSSLEYQRVCVNTDDGGVISLDWPAHLELREQGGGLDTTLLLIPATAQGSLDSDIRAMVCESLNRGCFPIVINPRGCAASPLTTPRLFSAADSDDICTAINFINSERPWATLMAIGWGYGANILTKYLGEVGDRTPLNAATCIDNPFDLQEATRSSHHYIDLDQKLTSGLVDILQSNKELFQGRAKGFNVEKALLSKSIRDFDEAISMISNGYDALGDFYAACTTRDVVMNVKIPVLFIQNNDGTLPLLSIPRGLIAENPFTSLLVYCFSPSQIAKTRSSSVHWSHHLSIEWLLAVELGLLKGRHPLLKDVDVTVNPSKGVALTEVRESVERGKMNKLPDVSPTSKANDGYFVHPPKDVVKEIRTSVNDGSKIGDDSRIISAAEDIAVEQIGTVDMESAEQGLTNEGGQVLQTADVVMNILDVTMPGTLTEERKKKALTAVAKGETVMKALQDAVPDDVREKLTTAVSKVLNDQGTTKKLDQLVNISRISDVASGLTSKIQEKNGELSSSGVNKNPRSLEQRHMIDKVMNDDEVTEGKPTGEPGTEHDGPGTLQKPASDGQLESTTLGIESSSSLRNDSAELEKIQEEADVSTERGDQFPEYTEGVSKRSEKTSDSEDITADELKANHDGESAKPDIEVADNIHQNVGSATKSSCDQNEAGTNKDEVLSDPSSSSESQLMEREGSSNVNEENQTPSSSNQSNSDAPKFDVSQAFDALSGMDDSTQVAVNSVFGVIEDMITQLEVEKDASGVADDAKGSEDMGVDSDNHRLKNDCNKSRETPNSEPDMMDHHCMDEGTESVVTRKTFSEQNNVESSVNTPLYITSSHYNDPLYNRYLQTYLLPKMPNSKALDLDGTTSLFLDYFPEEGRWKLLEPVGRNKASAGDIAADKGLDRAEGDGSPMDSDKEEFIEPPYVIMDAEKQKEMQGYDMIDGANATVVNNGAKELRSFIKNIIIDTMKFEVQRRLGDRKTQDLELLLSVDMEQVADTVIAGLDILRLQVPENKRYNSNKLGTLNGEQIIRAISFALPQTNDLRRVLPIGVAVGASLAALRRFFDVAAVNGIIQSEVVSLNQINGSLERNNVQLVKEEADEVHCDKIDQNYSVSQSRSEGEIKSEQLRNNTVMAGCVTAALGASALLVHQQDSARSDDIVGTSHKSSEKNLTHQKDLDEPDEVSAKNENNMVASLAEKAMSVAGPVVPMKEDGEVDQERLVAMLAEWGQKGGVLKLVGKVALLWGGMRGAMSLTYRLISFLRIAERPLLQRILGFVCMVLVLWSPVVVPLLPTLVQGWATHNSSQITELICLIGLYGSTMILVMLWGKRIRGYENPFQQYGLDFISLPKIQNLLKGLVGGIILVVLIHSLNVLLGCVRLSWPSTFVPHSPDAMSWLKVYCRVFLLVSQGIITATGIAVVEELLFRSWLPDEIAVDFGHHHAVIISGLTFAIFQRFPLAVPGLWLLSLSLSGARQRNQGSLSIPIGLRAGIMASSYVLQTGGFLTYRPTFPLWVTGTHPFQPFSGVAGFTLSLLLAVVLYPRHPSSILNRENHMLK